MALRFFQGAQVLPIGMIFDTLPPVFLANGVRDDNFEVYMIREGTVLRISQQNHPDRYLHIPMPIPEGANLVLQPW
jgi:hypothetical protein